MGGSLGITLGKNNVVGERCGYDLNEQTGKIALGKGAIDRWCNELPHCLAAAELVVLALPVRSIVSNLQTIAPYLRPGTIVTDMGSTKAEIVKAMEEYLPDQVWGVGGHPMAGSEQSGINAADGLMLEDAVYILTPGKKTPKAAVSKLEKMIRAIRARPLLLEPFEHDRLTALTSHLPHLVAVALSSMLSRHHKDKELLIKMAGKGFKDTTRIAMGDEKLWYDTFASNKYFLKKSLKTFLDELNVLYNDLESEDEKESKRKLQSAAAWRKNLNT